MNNELCIFTIRKDIYFDDKEKFEAYECRIESIDLYYPHENKEISDINEATINCIGRNQLPLNFWAKLSFRDFGLSLIILKKKIHKQNQKTFSQLLVDKFSRKKLKIYKKKQGLML